MPPSASFYKGSAREPNFSRASPEAGAIRHRSTEFGKGEKARVCSVLWQLAICLQVASPSLQVWGKYLLPLPSSRPFPLLTQESNCPLQSGSYTQLCENAAA